MPTATEFVVRLTEKVAEDLKKLVHELPEDKRGWRPLDKGRSALDQFAECALLNAYAAHTLTHREGMPAGFTMDGFVTEKTGLSQDWEALNSAFDANTAALLDAIRAFPEDSIGDSVAMPWGSMTFQQILGAPLWNMSYHEGQVSYIASLARQE